MKQAALSILFPYQDRVTYREIPEESWHDLGLDSLTEKVAAQPQEVPMFRRVMGALSADPAVAAFRSDVFEDILHHPEIRERLLKLLDRIKMFYDYGVVNRHEGDESGIWDLMHRLEEYHDYILTVEAVRECLSDKELVSEGLTGLRDRVEQIYEDQGFAALRKDVEELRVSASEIRSLTVGINLNDRFEAVSMGLVSVNGKAFTRSGILKNFLSSVVPRDEIRKEADWNGNYNYYPANTETGLLQAVGQLFILAQAGISVPAVRFSYDPADRVLTHFPADEDKTLDLGRLGEECRRFRELFVCCTPDSLLLLNETFSTTSFEEGYFIASDAVRAILGRGTRTIYNTHMHKLARDLDTAINSEETAGKAVSLVAETKEGKHSFRVIVGPPEGQSFARDIAEKYGVTYESLAAAKEAES